MALEFRNDPTYKATESGMFGARWRTAIWGVVTAALAMGGAHALMVGVVMAGAATAATAVLPIVGMFALGAAALGAAIYTGFKAYQAHIDERAGFADITAQRSAVRIGEVMEKQQQVSMAQVQAQSMEWQNKLAAQQAMAAGQNTGRPA